MAPRAVRDLGGEATGQVDPGLRLEMLLHIVARLRFEPKDAHAGRARAARAASLRRQPGRRLEMVIDEPVQNQMVQVVVLAQGAAASGRRPRRRRILVAADTRTRQIDDPL